MISLDASTKKTSGLNCSNNLKITIINYKIHTQCDVYSQIEL